jgi:hypothetical protein
MCKLEVLINAVDAKFNQADHDIVRKAEKSLTLDFTELASFQTLKARAQMKGIIDLETAQFIYNALGNWDKQTVGTKFILIKLHADLIKQSMQGAL